MKRSTERRAHFADCNQHLKYEFFDAIDGSCLSPDALKEGGLFAAGLPYTKGAYGCALSHMSLWEESIDRNQHLTICEDDAIFRLDFEEMQSALLAGLPADWDLVLWGWNLDSFLSLNLMPEVSPAVVFCSQEHLRRSVEKFQAGKLFPCLFPLDKCFGIPAYTISPRGAKTFKSRCFPQENFSLYFPVLKRSLPNGGIDIAMNRIYSTTISMVCFPPIVVSKNERAISTIQNDDYFEAQP